MLPLGVPIDHTTIFLKRLNDDEECVRIAAQGDKGEICVLGRSLSSPIGGVRYATAVFCGREDANG